jgi:histidyl-tRNA synthetase
MTIQRPRGTRDFLPEDAWTRSTARKIMQRVLERWGYQEISTPTFEHLELFTLKSGPSVIEEIYSFKDKGGRDLALRPELTAPVMRMYVNELQNVAKPLRLYYFGNCFRYERPQRGRFREFWQLGAEIIGGNKPDSEAEAIALADQVLRNINVSGEIHVGYLGLIRAILARIAPEHRPQVMRMIDKKERENLEAYLNEIGADGLGLRELINLKGKDALDKAFSIVEDLGASEAPASCVASPGGAEPSHVTASPSSSERGRTARAGREVAAELGLDEFRQTVELLDSYGVNYAVDFEIVRGLEYYSGTVFEIYAHGLGAQRQICGGGTYELCRLFGGAETSSTGFGLGFDRIMEVIQLDAKRKAPAVLVYTPDVKKAAVRIARDLRERVPLVIDVMGRGFGAQMKNAANLGAEYVILVGKNELDSGNLTLRDMKSGTQESLPLEEIAKRLAEKYSCA